MKLGLCFSFLSHEIVNKNQHSHWKLYLSSLLAFSLSHCMSTAFYIQTQPPINH